MTPRHTHKTWYKASTKHILIILQLKVSQACDWAGGFILAWLNRTNTDQSAEHFTLKLKPAGP